MSTKTTFKRIALVAAASLGLGIISSVPSQASYTSGPTVTTVSSSSMTNGLSDSSVAGTITVSWTADAADTVVVKAIQTAGPVANDARLGFSDTTGSFVVPGITGALKEGAGHTVAIQTIDSVASSSGDTIVSASAGGRHVVTFFLFLDSNTLTAADTTKLGTYTYDINVYGYYNVSNGVAAGVKTATASISLTAGRTTAQSQTASATTSTAYIASTSAGAAAATSDSVINALATASSTPRAYIYVNLKNASSGAAAESITATTNIGTVGDGTTQGKSVTLAYSGATTLQVQADGTAGIATVTVKSTNVTFAAKTVVFYASAPSTLKATVINSVPGTGSTTAIAVDAKDASGNRWAGTLYTYSSSTSVISNSAATCSYVAARDRHECSVTGVAAGTATVTVRDAATVATSTVASDALSLTVSSQAATNIKMAWDKATYAPGEKAILTIQVLDANGKEVPAATFGNAFATGGITFNQATGNGSDTTTNVSITTSSLAAAALGTYTAPVKVYTIYMPLNSGTMTASATGGTSLPLAGQVALTASATVASPAETAANAAVAAVTALASQVSAFITKVNAQITTLTDLVMKIQKKVKA